MDIQPEVVQEVLADLKTGRTGVGAVKMLQLMESRPQQGRVDKVIEEDGNVGVCSTSSFLLFPAKPSSHLWRRKVERTETGIESSEHGSKIMFLAVLKPIVTYNAYHLFCIRMYTIRINSSKVEELVDMS